MILTTAAVTMLAAFAQVARAQSERVTDLEIMTAIEQEYLRDDVIPFNRIEVVSEDGIVTLTGRVSNLAARLHAEEVAGIVKGVRSIVNRVEISTTPHTTDEIAAAVKAALRLDPTTDAYEIDVLATTAGIVRLTGEVDSWAERTLTENIAMTVPGVASIDNDISIDVSRIYRGEAEIGDDIAGRLRWDVRVDDSLIDILVREGGRVTLAGTVGSLAEKYQAERLAWVDGVDSVDVGDLDVRDWARDPDLRRNEPVIMSDEEIEQALRMALRYDPRVIDDNIDVKVEDGTALLRGSVDNLQAKRAAERDARNTVGIDRIFNHLKVLPMELRDSELEALIDDVLRGQGLLEDNDIEVNVSEGIARLEGDVDTLVEYWKADQATSAVRGLEDLRNDLTVRSETPRFATYWYGYYPRLMTPPADLRAGLKSDREIHEAVRSELFWSPFVDEGSVAIDVEDGLVRLSGSVGSEREWRAARDNAFEAGARVVKNELRIE